jgi:hypothetical protein
MTSINALRFDKYSGICIGDEAISTVADMRVCVGEKVRPFVPEPIVNNYGIVGVIGTTGTCSVGDSIEIRLKDHLKKRFELEVEKTGKKPDRFLNFEDIVKLGFESIMEIKHQRVGEKIKSIYDFNITEFLSGSYERNGQKYDIKDKDTVKEVVDLMVWRGMTDEVGSTFLNAGLFAGYDEEDGFQIYHYDLREGYWHRVQNCYMAEGSGRHSVDPAIYSFAEQWQRDERRGNIDPVEGSIALIHGINSASDHEIGVGGYYNIIMIDGRKENFKDRLWEINDDRSLLANHIVRANKHNFINYGQAYELIKMLLFENADFEEVYGRFWSTAKNPDELCRMLRKYKLISCKIR